MLRLNTSTQQAIAAMSRLAETYHEEGRWLSSADIAASRKLKKPVVAKVLTLLAQAGLVSGSPGPGGGYRLSRDPSKISLLDIIERFEPAPESLCPYGPDWCGNQSPCPLHDSIVALRKVVEDYLRNSRLDLFDLSEPSRHRGTNPPGQAIHKSTKIS